MSPQESDGVQYSVLAHVGSPSSQLSHSVLTAHDTNYAKLNQVSLHSHLLSQLVRIHIHTRTQFAEYACIERGSSHSAVNPLSAKQLTPLPPIPDESHTYCEINVLAAAQEPAERHDFINSLPSAGTTV